MNFRKFIQGILLRALGTIQTYDSLNEGFVYNFNNKHLRQNIAGFDRPLAYNPEVYLYERQATGVNGGSFISGAWRTRQLNTEVDTYGVCTLTAAQFTLVPGEYTIIAAAEANNAGIHQTRLRNITASTDIIIGTSSRLANASSSSFLTAQFTITVSTVFELQHRCSASRNNDGFGFACNFAGTGEQYAFVKIVKLNGLP